MSENKYIKAFQLAVASASAVLIILLIATWVISGPAAEWRYWQREYRSLINGMEDSIPELARIETERGIQEFKIDGLDRTDRCVTCHTGLENPQMKDAELPFRTHPGNFLVDHPVEEFGCTICHGGQGQAMNKEDAFGRDEGTNWAEPMFHGNYIQASCGKCHLAMYSEGEELAGTEVFIKGRELFSREGCLGCHKARGMGAYVGPDLTEQGEKTRHDYSFQNVSGEQTVPNWLKEHFKDPEMVSPGSQMLDFNLPEEELDALTTFVMGLTRLDIPFSYFSVDLLLELSGERVELSGKNIYGRTCSACHGRTGEGKDYTEFETGVPGIMRTDMLLVASDDLIRFTLLKGRCQRDMDSWDPELTGLQETELEGLVGHLKAQLPAVQEFSENKMRLADAGKGQQLYIQNCATCHGEQGEGGIGISLNNKELLRNASNRYLYTTLVNGRLNTAMPSWLNLKDVDLYHLVSYLRSWYRFDPASMIVSFENPDPETGKLRYHFLCSRCHGEHGQGQTGPAIANKGFLDAAGDDFLYNTIAFGRGHNAMFGWSQDVYNNEKLDKEEIGNIISFLRQKASVKPDYLYAGANRGDANSGAPLFEEHCSKCHGTNGEGKESPALNNQEFLNAATNGYILATMTVGRDGTRMPRWGSDEGDHPQLNKKQREDITAFIRNWQRIHIQY